MARFAFPLCHGSALLLLLLLVVVGAIPPVTAADLRPDLPQVRNCTGRTSATEDFLDLDDPSATCETKTTVSVDFKGSQQEGQDRTSFYQNGVGPTGVDDLYTYQGFYIRVVRRATVVRHRLSYLGTFNAKPYENTVSDSNCNADFDPVQATCGLAMGDDGYYIVHSQSFCCDCTRCKEGSCGLAWRANACTSTTTRVGACLRMNPLNYAGYSIEPVPQFSYLLDVQVWGNATDYLTENVFSLRPINTSVTISPDFPEQYNGTDQVIVKFQNKAVDQNVQGGAILANITTKDLFVPVTPATDARVKAGASEWILLDPTSVTVDDSECNKVGTSYRAFSSQQDPCTLNVGTCLSNQLEDIRATDLMTMSMGMLGSYLAPNYGNFSFQTAPDGTTFLTYSTTAQPADATLDVIFNGDTLMTRTYAGTAAIANLYVAPATDAHVPASLERSTLSYNATTGVVSGGISVEVRSAVDYTAHFRVMIDGCTDTLDSEAIYPLWVTLAGSASANVTLLLRTNPGSWLNVYVACTVHLLNYAGWESESRRFNWALTDTGFQLTAPDTPVPWTTKSPETTTGPQTTTPTTNSCDGCGFFTISRNLRQVCVKFVVANAVVLAAILLLAALGVSWILCRLGCCTKGGGDQDSAPESLATRLAARKRNGDANSGGRPTDAAPATRATGPSPTPQELFFQQEQQYRLHQQQLQAQMEEERRAVEAAVAAAAAADRAGHHPPYGTANSLGGGHGDPQTNSSPHYQRMRFVRVPSYATDPAMFLPQQQQQQQQYRRAVVEEIDSESEDESPAAEDSRDTMSTPQAAEAGTEHADNSAVEDVVPLPTNGARKDALDRQRKEKNAKGYTANLEDIDEDADDASTRTVPTKRTTPGNGSAPPSNSREPFP